VAVGGELRLEATEGDNLARGSCDDAVAGLGIGLCLVFEHEEWEGEEQEAGSHNIAVLHGRFL
jgi:hypothetical protein